ncbi:MAG: MBL fold metallo-hydrolase [Spirochaetales bacterium]|nr:MBL fold metallo-hydrolase [Spirochaetales bacterium]
MKALRFVGLLLLALVLVSCASSPQTKEPAVNPLETGPAEHHFSEGINGIFTPDYDSVGIQGRMIPWNRNASQYAKDTSSLYFYFMAGEETPVEGVGEKIGDSCLAAFPDGTLMLIDANQDGYTPQLVANLKALGVTHLDYVLFSHPHSDHYMGFVNPEGITANFTVGKVYYNGTGNAGHTKISNICSQKGIPMEILKEGDSLTIGGVKIDILNPTEAVSASTVSATEETNNSSICMMLTYGTKKALFTGDMYKSGLTALVKRYGSALDADFLKIPHHGHSETSILDSFASAVSADLALASSGVPLNASVYGCYAKTGTTVLGDYTEGYIVVHTDGQKLEYETSRTRATDYYTFTDSAAWNRDNTGSADVYSYATGAFTVVSTIQELQDALSQGLKNIRLGADLNVNTYATASPLVLDMTGVVLDMNGFGFRGVASVVSDIKNKGQNTRYNLQFKGRAFAVLNGYFTKTMDGGYALQINAEETDPEKNSNIILDGISMANGGLDIRGSAVTLRNCNMNQPLGNTQNFTTLMFTDSYVTIESGRYRNVSNYSYKRWLKLYNAKAWVRNGVRWDGTVLYSVEDSMLLLDKN